MAATRFLAAVSLAAALAGCAGDAEFGAQLSGIRGQVEADADAARRCGDQLRAVTDRAPRSALRALEDPGSAGASFVSPGSWAPRTAPALARRSREEIARRLGAIGADVRIASEAAAIGPAALDRAVGAVAQARQLRERLCQARDVASTLAELEERDPGAERTASLHE